MNRTTRAGTAVVGAFAFSAAGLLSLSSTAYAGPPPGVTAPAFTDGSSLGGLVLENAQGMPVTSGDISADATFPFAVASGPGRGLNDSVATLNVATPKAGQTPDLWTTDQLNDSEPYNPATQPPTNTGRTGAGLTLSQYIGLEGRNTSTSTSDGYGNYYELRLSTSTPKVGGQAGYYTAVIYVTETPTTMDGNTPAAGTWSLVTTSSTETAVSATPASTATSPTPVSFRATTQTADGTVPAGSDQLYDGTKPIGSAVPAVGGVATLVTTPTVGKHTYTIVFTPSDSHTASTSNYILFTENAAVATAALPEAPYALLLPLVAGGLGAGLLMRRRKVTS